LSGPQHRHRLSFTWITGPVGRPRSCKLRLRYVQGG
jgi:hypothetical protein